MYIVLLIILIIILTSAAVALIAFVSDQLTKKETVHQSYGPYERYFKRPLDAFLATGAFIVFSPIIFVVSLLVMLKLGTPIIFVQERPGRYQKIFHLYKFRSMTNAKDANGNLLPDKDRLTRFGKILRSTSLDELPELINIIKGDMSIIGPRPLLVKYLGHYNKHDQKRHEVRPGLTGLAQVSGRNAISWKEKFEKDIEYVDHLTFMMDIRIILQTIKKVFVREGIEFKEGHQSVMDYFAEQNEQENRK